MKPTLYLLPGLLCDEAVWEHQKAALEPYADVRIPVFRGFDSFSAMAQHVLRDAPSRFSVVGHSMGGRIAFELMARAGEGIDKFAVMDTGVHPVQPGEAAKRQVLLDLAATQGLKAVSDAWTLPMLHPDRHQDEALITAIEAMILRNRVEDFRGQVAALLNRGDQSRYLAGIRQHVLLICGDQDSWSPVSQHEAMLASLSHGELAIIKNSGHMATMEQPDQVNEILLKWWLGGI